MRLAIFKRFLNSARYILGERTVVLQDSGDFEKLRIHADGKKKGSYSVSVNSKKIKIKKSGFLSSASHYASISEVQGGIEFEIKMNKMERGFVIVFVYAMFLVVIASPIVFVVGLMRDGYTEGAAMVSALIALAAIVLLVCLRLICLFLVFQSGVGNPSKVLKVLRGR